MNTGLLNCAFYSVQCRIILMKEAMETGIMLKKQQKINIYRFILYCCIGYVNLS